MPTIDLGFTRIELFADIPVCYVILAAVALIYAGLYAFTLSRYEQIERPVLLAALQAFCGNDLALTKLIDIPSIWTAPETAFARKVTSEWQKVTGQGLLPPTAASYFTDGAFLQGSDKSTPVMILGPGNPAIAHKTDETCDIARICVAETVDRALMDRRLSPA